MKKEVVLVITIGLFLLSYFLEAIVNPLSLQLSTPYHYFNSAYLATYPFTTALILVRSLGVFIIPLLFMSFIENQFTAKGAVLLVAIVLMQLYALQDVATKAAVVPLEWALAISIAGIMLVFPMIWFFILGSLTWLHRSLGGKSETLEQKED